MGLRLSEALSIQASDSDSERGLLYVRQFNGNKDRFVILPEMTLQALHNHWVTHRNPNWLFPRGKMPGERHHADTHMDRGGTQKSFKAIVAVVGIKKT